LSPHIFGSRLPIEGETYGFSLWHFVVTLFLKGIIS